MKSKKPFVAFVIMVAVQVGLVAATQASAAEYQQAKFKAEVKGVQTFHSVYNHESTETCDPTINDETTETVRFKSLKPVVLTVTKIPNVKDPVITSGVKPLRIGTKAAIKRANNYSVGTVPPTCPDNGGGVTTPTEAPDCGTKTITPWWMTVDYYKADHVELQPEDQAGSDPFERCASGRFPNLLTGESFGKRQSAELPVSEVFDAKIGKLITIGKGTEGIVNSEGYEDTKLDWELSLTRIGK
jgi:hypothetical protein